AQRRLGGRDNRPWKPSDANLAALQLEQSPASDLGRVHEQDIRTEAPRVGERHQDFESEVAVLADVRLGDQDAIVENVDKRRLQTHGAIRYRRGLTARAHR